jgi:hypothetical protein
MLEAMRLEPVSRMQAVGGTLVTCTHC